MQQKSNIEVLLIEDSESDRAIYRDWLSEYYGQRAKIIEAINGREAEKRLNEKMPNLVVLDFILFDKDGFELLDYIREHARDIPPIIFLTGHGNLHMKQDALALGAAHFFDKNELTKEQFCDTLSHLIV